MKPYLVIMTSLLSSLLLTACSGVSTTADYDINHDFSAYQTFQWHPSGPPQTEDLNKMGSDIFHQRLTRITEQKLANKGYSIGDTPQFYVNYSVTTKELATIDTFHPHHYNPIGWNYSYHHNPHFRSSANSHSKVNYYTQGTVIFDVIDANKNLLVWRGSANSRLTKHSTPTENEQKLSQLVEQIFTQFPPQALNK